MPCVSPDDRQGSAVLDPSSPSNFPSNNSLGGAYPASSPNFVVSVELLATIPECAKLASIEISQDNITFC